MKYILIAFALLLASCSTISAAPSVVPADSKLGKDLLAAAYNLDNAVAIGALSPKDPALRPS